MLHTSFALQLAHTLAPETRDSGLRIIHNPEGAPIGSLASAFTFRGARTPRHLREPGASHHPDTIVLTAEAGVELLLHELAHALPVAMPATTAEVEKQQLPEALETFVFAHWALEDKLEPDPDILPWQDHGVPFVRALCHLYHRATAIHGMQLDQFAMLHPYYCLSPLENFISRLQSEIYTYSRSSFDKIFSSPPPDFFTELFLQDIVTYLKETRECEQSNALQKKSLQTY